MAINNNEEISSEDEEILSCLNLNDPKSFFLFAGAGSGKTRSLVTVLTLFRKENASRLLKNNQKVAIITYTNAACDEIKRRLEFDSTFHVSTIHSFAWELIAPYTADIISFLTASLEEEITDLEDKQAKARSLTTKTYIDRASKIESKGKRLIALKEIKQFTYSPNGENLGKDSLNHAEVINIAANFIQKRPLMQRILVCQFPILLIDECQDTKKELVEAFLEVQKQKSDCFTLGMFGDTMQRIYSDGKADLSNVIPESWLKPAKSINYRSPSRVITLINKIRIQVDHQQQVASKEIEGKVRLFIIDANKNIDYAKTESDVFDEMAVTCNDTKWQNSSTVKILTLEHHMAARRAGFASFFDPIYSNNKLRTGLLDGTLSGVSLFTKRVFPLVTAKQSSDEFAVSKVVREYSPLLKKDKLQSSKLPIENIRAANKAVSELYNLWDAGAVPTLGDILKEVSRTKLFLIPEILTPIAKRLNSKEKVTEDSTNSEDQDEVINSWEEALDCPFDQFVKYISYISNESTYGTHQGIKGLQYPRVMVILDDDQARGFLFSYEKLLGALDPSDRDKKNESEGLDTSINRSRRLLYVTCSRAEESLAVVAYTKNPAGVKQYAINQGWFGADEIIQL